MWNKIEREERIREFEIKRAEALGTLLGMIDAMLTLHDLGLLKNDSEGFDKIRAKRAAYDEADKAYLAARLA